MAGSASMSLYTEKGLFKMEPETGSAQVGHKLMQFYALKNMFPPS